MGGGVDVVAPFEATLVVCAGFCVGFARWCRREIRVARFGGCDRAVGLGVLGDAEALLVVVDWVTSFEKLLAVWRGVDAVQVGVLVSGLGSGFEAHAEFDEVRTGNRLVGVGRGLVGVLGSGFEAFDWVEGFLAEVGLDGEDTAVGFLVERRH